MDRDARGGCGTLCDRIRSTPESAETGEGDPLAALCNENGIHPNVPRVLNRRPGADSLEGVFEGDFDFTRIFSSGDDAECRSVQKISGLLKIYIVESVKEPDCGIGKIFSRIS